MSWIQVIEKDQATKELKDIYEELEKKRGKISNIMKIQSLKPELMKKHLELYISIMFRKSGLSRETKELIAVIVSLLNKCKYCVNHHTEALNHYWKNRELIEKLIKNYKSIDLTTKQSQMIRYIYKLTRNPNEIVKEDVDKLREFGFSDEDILDINLIASYFNFVNRMALGLGVKFNKDELKGYIY